MPRSAMSPVLPVKKYLLTAIAIFSSLIASAQQNNPPLLKQLRPAIGDIEQVYDVTDNELGEMALLFSDRHECLIAAEAQAVHNHESPVQLVKRKASIPPGGYLGASWNRPTAAMASADKFVFTVVAANGRQICRWKSRPTVPQRISARGQNIYVQTVLVPLPESLPDFTSVTVMEVATGKQFKYLIRP